MMEVNANEFYKLMQEDKIVLVDFYAVWCGPCRMQAPILEEVQDYYKSNEKVVICKINVDEENEIAMDNGIMNIPTLLIFNAGKMVEKFVGVTYKEDLIEKIDKYL